MKFKEPSEELKAKVRKATSAKELLELAEQEGIELSDKELEGVAGGMVLWGECPDDNYTPY